MSWLGGNSDASSRRSGTLTVLDVGSSKVCCVVAKLKPREDGKLLPPSQLISSSPTCA